MSKRLVFFWYLVSLSVNFVSFSQVAKTIGEDKPGDAFYYLVLRRRFRRMKIVTEPSGRSLNKYKTFL